jgi:hypothetical protein
VFFEFVSVPRGMELVFLGGVQGICRDLTDRQRRLSEGVYLAGGAVYPSDDFDL